MANHPTVPKFVISTIVFILVISTTFDSVTGQSRQNDVEKISHHIQKHGDRDLTTASGKSKANPLVQKPGLGHGHAHEHHAGINDLDFSESDNNGPEDEDDYEGYSDESNPNELNSWGHDFDNKDLSEISEIDKEEEKQPGAEWTFGGPRKIGKCCPVDQSLNSEGRCKKSHPVNKHSPGLHHDVSWFPEKVYAVEKENWTTPVQEEWEITYNHSFKCPPNESSEVVFDVNRFVVLDNGRLFLSHHNKDVVPLNFCVDLLIGHGRAVRTCFTKSELCGQESNCLRKCCPEKAMVQEPTASCVVTHHKDQNNFPKDKWNIVHGSPSCPSGQFSTEITSFAIGTDGSLIATSGNLNITARFLDYCLDFFTETEELKKKILDSEERKGSNESVLKAMICFDPIEDRTSKYDTPIAIPQIVHIIYGSALILSAICIALAAFVSWRLAELRTLHGKCQLSHLATLFCLCVMLATVHLGSDVLLPGRICTFLAIAIHMCALSAFLWLNLLCVNIYLTFRSLRPPLSARRAENKRLIVLCVYAWGVPATFCTFLALIDGRLENMPKAGYGVNSCLISNREGQFAYLFGPIGLLLCINGVLFALTARELLCGLWRLDNSDSINFRRKSMGIVVGKMAVVMGMGWILDFLSWGIGSDLPYLFFASDLFNSLQGVFIFLVLIWRKRVLEILHLRKGSVVKDDTVTAARPFLPKSSLNTSMTNHNGDADTSLVLIQEH